MVEPAFSARKDPVLAMVVVLALHVLMLYAIHRARMQERDDRALLDQPLLLVSIPERNRVESPPTDREPALSPIERRASRANEARTVEVDEPQSEPQPRGAINWRANAVRSAEVVAEAGRQEGYRRFGPRKPQPQDEAIAPSIFKEPPKHKLGEEGSDAHGDPVVWISDNCYTTLDKRVQTARDWIKAGPGNFAPAEFECMFSVGRREPDGTLFEHIKKPEEPPLPKQGTEMNALPERIEEGGVFER